jgi:hypothetical protein
MSFDSPLREAGRTLLKRWPPNENALARVADARSGFVSSEALLRTHRLAPPDVARSFMAPVIGVRSQSTGRHQ